MDVSIVTRGLMSVKMSFRWLKSESTRARIDKGVASLIILSSAGYSWGREAEKLWAEIWNLTHESWS